MGEVLHLLGKKRSRVKPDNNKANRLLTNRAIQNTMLVTPPEAVEDIEKLCGKLQITEEEAVKVADDFYRTYPMLIEWVRSQEYMRGRTLK